MSFPRNLVIQTDLGRRLLCFLAAGWALHLSVSAVTLPHIFGDHMVLQSGQPVPIWGSATPGETIAVAFAGQRKTVTAASDGRWEVRLEALPPSAQPRDLTISSTETVTFRDVLVGEVWLCSGQSNMQKPIGTWRGQPIATIDSEKELAAADYPLIRLMNLEPANEAAPARDVNIKPRGTPDFPWKGWVVCNPASLDEVKFSAVGYFFARKVFTELKIPIGMIEATVGGTHIESWTPAEGFASDPALADLRQAAQTPTIKFHGSPISTLYNGMIHPLVPMALRGVLWYQGESNLMDGDVAIYANKLTALIASWRAAWGRELPFYFVQLPPLLYSQRRVPPHTPEDEAFFREAQAAALKLPKTGAAITTDVGDLKNIHPPHKKEVGERLAALALAKDYGLKKIEPSGPIYREGSIEREGPKAVLHFDHVGKGLVSSDGGPLTWFTAAGADGIFYPATAEISGDAVVITSSQVHEPREVRFAWTEAANPNFFNKDGLPAAPFRTDRFPPPRIAPAPVATPAPIAPAPIAPAPAR